MQDESAHTHIDVQRSSTWLGPGCACGLALLKPWGGRGLANARRRPPSTAERLEYSPSPSRRSALATQVWQE